MAGTAADYRDHHPDHALLVVEIADSSLPQDRLTKTRIYARAGVVEYWIINLRDRCVEVHAGPDVETRRYTAIRTARTGDVIEPVAFPGAVIAVADLVPSD